MSKKKKITNKDKNLSIALFKARLSAEADGEDLEDKYVTSCYVVMREFGYTIQELLETPATTFLMILEEMQKQNEREKEEMDRNKNRAIKH